MAGMEEIVSVEFDRASLDLFLARVNASSIKDADGRVLTYAFVEFEGGVSPVQATEGYFVVSAATEEVPA